MNISLDQRTLSLAGSAGISDVPENVTIVDDPLGAGAFLSFAAKKPFAHQVFGLGRLENIRRFTCCHRPSPFWMTPKAGTRAGETPPETQFFLAERNDGKCILLVPLLDGAFRASLQGAGEHGLELLAESGDPFTLTASVIGLFVAVGEDPFALAEASAISVMRKMGTGRLRKDKPVPAFIDTFGWCTYDAFYHAVSKEKIRQGLESFAPGGVMPKYLVLDDGWLAERNTNTFNRQLNSFVANEKFPGDLSATIDECKTQFGIERFLVWHTLAGSWAGINDQALRGYGARQVEAKFSETMMKVCFHLFDWWSPIQGVIPPDEMYRFHNDFHRHLRAQGVDGIKVDGQAAIEGVAAGFGGRVSLMRKYHESLEGSAQVHFEGNLINCMSCSNDMIYSTLASTLVRTSDDFYPSKPASHGLHLYVNAQVCFWFGQFVHGDWDMFQSGHPAGPFHAAGRAVSGGPVYVSDKPDGHDFALLKKLVLPDGRILRARHLGRPTRDCLFADPTREEVLLKIFNLNLNAGIVAAFNAHWPDPANPPGPITGSISPRDVEGLPGNRFAVYAHHASELRILGREEYWPITLPPLGCELFTIVPLDENRFAPIGLSDMFNSAGGIEAKGFDVAGDYKVTLRAPGRFLAWSAAAPLRVECDGAKIDFTYRDNVVELTARTAGTLRFVFQSRGL